jgi:nitrous oxidase accessory protein NosD
MAHASLGASSYSHGSYGNLWSDDTSFLRQALVALAHGRYVPRESMKTVLLLE